jgi:hypothetical protein
MPDIIIIESLFRTATGTRTTEPANYTDYTIEYRVIIADILNKEEIKRWQ